MASSTTVDIFLNKNFQKKLTSGFELHTKNGANYRARFLKITLLKKHQNNLYSYCS
jgi:hypothetical protein